jgi:uncharacterized membrane protein
MTNANGRQQSGAIAIVAAIFVIYAGLSYYSDSTPAAVGLATGLSLAPVLLIAVVLLWRWTGGLIASSLTLVGCVVLYTKWAFLEEHYQWSNLVQQCGAYALAALGFARSLFAGQVPLCTKVMEKMHGALTAAETSYTRRATVAWAIFYALLTLAILVLFLVGPMRVWSFFTNFGTYVLMALMFAGEHALRAQLLPRRPNGGIWPALRQLLGGP